jgi:hypothetical protein
MDIKHDLGSVSGRFPKNTLQNIDDKLHGGVVVVMEENPVELRFFDLQVLFGKYRTLPVFFVLCHILCGGLILISDPGIVPGSSFCLLRRIVPIRKLLFCSRSALCSKFYPGNINYMPVVKFFACLYFERKSTFCKRLLR